MPLKRRRFAVLITVFAIAAVCFSHLRPSSEVVEQAPDELEEYEGLDLTLRGPTIRYAFVKQPDGSFRCERIESGQRTMTDNKTGKVTVIESK